MCSPVEQNDDLTYNGQSPKSDNRVNPTARVERHHLSHNPSLDNGISNLVIAFQGIHFHTEGAASSEKCHREASIKHSYNV